MADVNWEKIKVEYITTDISLTQLADKHKVSRSSAARRSTKEKWVEQRERYKTKVTTKTVQKSANREANRLARLMDTTSKAIDVAAKAFEDADQFNRYIVEKREKYAFPTNSAEYDEDPPTDAAGLAALVSERQWTEEKVYAKIDTKALKDMTAVLKDLTALMRDFYNIPTPAQAEAQRIAAERLELDKRKAEAADSNTDGIEITFSAGEEEWNE